MIFDVLQLIGGIILAFGYIPQIIQIIKTKSVKDLNPGFLFSVFFGIVLMEIYAINMIIHNIGQAFFITNTISLVLSATLCILFLKYYRRK